MVFKDVLEIRKKKKKNTTKIDNRCTHHNLKETIQIGSTIRSPATKLSDERTKLLATISPASGRRDNNLKR